MRETEEGNKRPGIGNARMMMAVLFGSIMFATTAMAAEGEEAVWVNGQNITEAEQNTVECGEGTAVYDASKHILSLNNAVITAGDEDGWGITAEGEPDTANPLVIQLTGSNVIQAEKDEGILSGIYTSGSLTIEGAGTLRIEGDCGIYSASDVQLKNSKLSVTAKEAAVQAEGDVGIEGTAVTALSSEDMGVCVGGTLTFASGSLYGKGAPGMPGVAAVQSRTADEEPSPQIEIKDGFGERNGGELGVSDWFEVEGETLAWTSFLNPGEKGKLAEDLSNAMNEVRLEKKGTWLHNRYGWWYQYADKSYPVNQWKYIDKEWYYFDGSGYMVTGWLKKGEIWYYLKGSGAMATDWCKVGNTWYYLKEDGAMAKGWLLLGDDWYYLRWDGGMVTGWYQAGNTWYYLRGDGRMAVGWYKVGNTWYYLKESGAMATGWLLQDEEWYYLRGDGGRAAGWCKVGNTWYYLKADGKMATGWLKLGSTWYYLKPDGAMATGLYAVGGKNYVFDSSGAMKTGWAKTNNIWYYLKPDGSVYTGWLKEGNITYYLKEDGAMATGWYLLEDKWYYANSSGGMKKGWLKQGNTWYYLRDTGVMATGWIKEGSTWYYLKENGAMAVGWIKDKEIWYYLNKSGAMAVNQWIGNYYVGSSGAMYTAQYTPDGYYVDAAGVWMPLTEDDMKIDGDRLVTKYYHITLPKSWDGRIEYVAGRNMWIFLYADSIMDEKQKRQEEIFTLEALRTEQDAREYVAKMEDGRNLGQHSSLWFIAGREKKSVIDLYSKAQQGEIMQMRKDVESILDSIVFR
jgi:glucan-binding YG repeat protein